MSDPNAFTGVELDRAADGRRRDAGWLAAQFAHPDARAVVAGTAGVRADDGRLTLLRLAELDGREPILLGLGDAGPVFAVDEDPPGEPGSRPPFVGAGGRRGEPPPAASGHLPLREAASALSAADAGLVAYAAALLNWHRRHRRCPNCGGETDLGEGGFTRRCRVCGLEHHPRVDPVVIMLVTGEDRVLLGRQASWPPRRYSALAGFVGPGESLEEAVAREVEEEAGVAVGAAALPLLAAVAVPRLADARLPRARGRPASRAAPTPSCRTCAGSPATRSPPRPSARRPGTAIPSTTASCCCRHARPSRAG